MGELQRDPSAGTGGDDGATAGDGGSAGPIAGIDLQRYWGIVVKRKWLGLGILLAALGVAVVVTVKSRKIYRADVTLEIDKQPPEVLGSDVKEVVQLGTGEFWSDLNYYETQYKILKSRDIGRRTAERLSLDRNADFARTMGFEPGTRSLDEIADMIAGATIVEPVKDSMLVHVEFESPDPKIATMVANGLANAYLERNVESRLEGTQGAVKWLGEEADRLRQQLDQSETKLYEFKRDNDVLSVSLEDRVNIVSQQIQKTSDELTTVRNRRIELAAERDQLLTEKNADPLSQSDVEVAESNLFHDAQIVQQLKKAYVDESLALAGLTAKYGDKMPAVIAQAQKVETIHDDLARETTNVIKAVDNEYSQLLQTEDSLRQELSDLTQQALALNKKEIGFDQLKRANDNNAKLYDMVTGRLKQSNLIEQLRTNNVQVLDAAEVPKRPVRPSLTFNLAVGLLLGVGLAFFAMFGVEYLDRSVKTHADIEQELGLTFLGLVPRLADGATAKVSDLFVHENPKSAAAEACRSIRTNLLFASADRRRRSILVTSAGPAEGKTLTAVSIAIAMAQGGNKTLLVDTDMRRPRLHRALGVPSDRGLSNAIIGDLPVMECVRRTDVAGLSVIPCGAVPPNPSELLQSDRFRELFQELASQFDTVILDSPPIIAVTDSAILSRLVDGAILVARAGQTHRDVLSRARFHIVRVGGKVLGCVLNDVPMNRRGYGSGYYYYYSRYGYQSAQADEKA